MKYSWLMVPLSCSTTPIIQLKSLKFWLRVLHFLSIRWYRLPNVRSMLVQRRQRWTYIGSSSRGRGRFLGWNALYKFVYLYFFILFSFWPINYLKQIEKYTQYIILYDIARAALERAYKSLCKLDSNYIHIHLCTKSKIIKMNKKQYNCVND